jgi:hypothetical protein
MLQASVYEYHESNQRIQLLQAYVDEQVLHKAFELSQPARLSATTLCFRRTSVSTLVPGPAVLVKTKALSSP